ncbi:uncharacterized protein LOC112341962 [Selaginella moellendorffii]|uniref:uncharacterized protein LOC112341962 n=1 Tax=Selaginella moellendorffii TaxID=88036 RepID=UPI000D1CF654|nr:uncharacterized protein LOC112341962 [Selaginella moellendorffii]|eukprot:XP_024518755.1 uncharacterized protein LOC112341962 [Selaginella moellendorffii]
MAALVLGGAVVSRTERLVPLSCYGDARRRHERRRRRQWDGKTQQQQQQQQEEEESRVSITVEDLGSSARDALVRMARRGDEWRASLVSMTCSAAVVGRSASAADLMGLGALCLLLVALATKAVMALAARGKRKLVVRRDRSLGGREVVVAAHNKIQSRPLIPLHDSPSNLERRQQQQRRPRKEELPAWWRHASSPSAGDSFAQAEANALVRAVVNKRLGGVDFDEEDAVQLRQICRHSGARVDFGTENTRDSFFRAAVGFVLSACSRLISSGDSEVEYGGESMVSFVCGLAANIGLEPAKAASIVNAAVAARTRAGFLQAWANVAQERMSDAMSDIRQLVCMHRVFPPEPNSPHMEMVGRGLEAHLTPQERLELLQIYSKLSAQGARVAEEALSLPSSWISLGD